jgi:hypothetical protein
MFKRLLIISIASLSIIAFSSIAWSSVEGDWDVLGKMTVKVSIKGHKAQTARTVASDAFTFDGNGQFEMIDMDGTWSQKKNKFTVYLDPETVSEYFASGLSDGIGTDVSVTVTKMVFTGTELKNGTIKGSFKLYMSFYIEDYDLPGKITASVSFTGRRADVSGLSSIKGQDASQSTGSVFDVVGEELNNAVESDIAAPF